VKIGRHAPLVLGALLVLRVVACGDGNQQSTGAGGSLGNRGGTGGGMGGTAGTAGGTAGTTGETAGTAGGTAGTTGSAGSTGEAATCVNGVISYSSGGQRQTHACPVLGCWIDVSTGSAACMYESTAGTPPFRTCRTAADCSGAAYCAAWGDTFEILLGSAMCMDGVCDWAAQTQMPCAGSSEYCWQTGCMTVQRTTSGGFPWTGAAGSFGGSEGGVAGASGTAGVGGTTSEQDASQPADATGN
jgi:hypothetical protein